MSARIIVGDCLTVMPTLAACSVDAIVCDPPYGLSFMGKDWDHGVPGEHFWREALRVAKPGAHLIAFGGTRTYHRLVCAVEDAGWEVRDMLAWIHGQGFPKGTDKATIPEAWHGWNTALKPAIEPIVLARKPFDTTVAANLLQHGTGALNIDACRIATLDDLRATTGAGNIPCRHHDGAARTGGVLEAGSALGRWPANVLHDGSDEVVVLFPESKGQQGKSNDSQRSQANCFGAVGGNGKEYIPRGDSGSASRFFYCAKADRADRNEGCEQMPKRALNWSSGEQSPGTFQAEGTDRSAHNHHPTVKPTDLMRYLCRLITPPDGLILDPFAGSGSTGKAALLEGFRFIGIELSDEYASIARARIHAAAPLFTNVHEAMA